MRLDTRTDLAADGDGRVRQLWRGVDGSPVQLEDVSTDDDDHLGHVYGRASSRTRLQIFYDARPNGNRAFADRESFTRGELVGIYQAEESFQMDGRADVFTTQVPYTLKSTTPFTPDGVTVDLSALAPG